MPIGDNIKKIRNRRGINQRILADKINVTTQTISRWERGEREPKATEIASLARELKVSASVLLDGRSIGPRMETAREAAGLSIEELAQKANVSPAHLLAWENEDSKPEIEDVQAIKEALETSYSQLLDGVALPETEEQIREQIEWAAENSDGIPGNMLGMCLDRPEMVEELAPHWDIKKALREFGIREDIPGNKGLPRKYELTPIPLLDPSTFTACCGGGFCYDDIEVTAVETVPFALETLGLTYTDNMFCVKAEGDSMRGAGILPGSLCLIVPYSDLGNGDIVMAIYGGNSKKWLIRYAFFKPDGTVILKAANPEYEEITVSREEQELEWLTIAGEVMAVQLLPRRAL